MLQDTTHPNYRVGQIWNYQTRPQDTGSTLTICKIESHPKFGIIIHIHLDGLKLKNPHHAGGFSSTIAHSPVSQTSLEASHLTLKQEDAPLPNFEEGYAQWRAAFDAGKAGVFTIPLSQIPDFIETALNG